MTDKEQTRTIHAVHALKKIEADPDHEVEMASDLRSKHDLPTLLELYGRFSHGLSQFDFLMRRIFWRAMCKSFGNGVTIGEGVGFKHIETFEIGDGVFFGAQSYIQGRFDGLCKIGTGTWIGPQSYFDARDLIMGEYVGWGPGAKVLGSEHKATPIDLPILKTDLEIRPVRIDSWCDVGTNAIILPGITLNKGCIVGAGSVVTHDVDAYAIVAGVPAKLLRYREGHEGLH